MLLSALIMNEAKKKPRGIEFVFTLEDEGIITQLKWNYD